MQPPAAPVESAVAASSDARLRPGYEPVPGYCLLERIGRGGFGEVWKASAPGGMFKAVKFVHGSMDQHRGGRELKSLERIKRVSHPFLLTLERFEVVDDRLVIVTELADGSLEDVVNRHRQRGSCGIPRAALLSYLHDAADALDYLHHEYQLQHLDIKPGNLLLVGGHVKVADFGLLKDLREVECSVVGGLTPIYAPPEVFDGRPSPHSDQYSLAVMYQELLTGSRPFSGRTIAQLATQHVHSAPDLTPLPAIDRPIVARALEKNPDRRYAGCREFVNALQTPRGRSHASPGSAVTVSAQPTVAEGDTQTDSFVAGGANDSAAVQDLPDLQSQMPVAPVPAVEHALVVAAGGTGAEVLYALRQRAASHHDGCQLQLHTLLLDTDIETISAAQLAAAGTDRGNCHCLYTPLRTAHQYRDAGTERLRTVSRRWIYNVPRSGITEGMRPLGRLALVDHGAKVLQALQQSVAKLAAAVGDRTPRVYLVGSLSGGTGSGMLLDLSYLLRHTLDQSELERCDVLPLLFAGSLQSDPRRTLGMAAAQAALLEMQHYLQPGNGYPGDAGAGWPGVPAARSPLTDAYVMFGDEGVDPRAGFVQSVAQYIWADSTGAGPLLAAARRDEDPQTMTVSGEGPWVRSLGVARLSVGGRSGTERVVPALVFRLMQQWMGRPSEARQMASTLADRLSRKSGLHPAGLAEAWSSDVGRGAAGTGHEPWFSAAIESLRREVSVRLLDRRLDLASAIEAVHLLTARIGDQTRLAEAEGPPDWRLLVASLDTLVETLTDQAARVAAVMAAAASGTGVAAADPWVRLPADVRQQWEPTLDLLHGEIVQNHLIMPIMRPSQEPPVVDLSEAAYQAAESLVQAGEDATRTDIVETAPADRASAGAARIAAALRAARPGLLRCGGRQRVLLLVGSDADRQRLQPQVEAVQQGPLTTAVVPGAPPMIVHEAQQIPLRDIVGRLATRLGGQAELTGRLHARADVSWHS